jgi:hypothetical protein
MEQRAIRNGWDTPEPRKAKILDSLYYLVTPKPGRPRKGTTAAPPDPELVVRVARTLIIASIAQQRLDLLKARDGGIGPRIEGDVIAEAHKRALERRAERDRDQAARDAPE